ncbi:hypothetical protein [Roseomonas genomospecies 6]|nr:hypothetical protein [Roseomonas genomospecies 6]
MSITKATREAVQAAYDGYLARGIVPTVGDIIQQTGGSKSTVCGHLRAIRATPIPSTTAPPSPSTSPSMDGPAELPLEWLELADLSSRTVASILTRTIADERKRTAQLLDAEVAARSSALASARAETEELRRAFGHAEADFETAAGEVTALLEVVAILLEAVGLDASDDLGDLREAAVHAVNRIRELTGTAARIPALEAELEQRISEVRTAEARIADLQDAANRAERRHQELLGTASRVPTLEAAVQAAEVRIAGLSAQLFASAKTAGKVEALEGTIVQLTNAMAAAAASPAAPSAQPRSRPAKRAAAAPAARAEKNGAAAPPEPETTSADQPLANLVLTAPSPADGGSSDAPPPLAAA